MQIENQERELLYQFFNLLEICNKQRKYQLVLDYINNLRHEPFVVPFIELIAIVWLLDQDAVITYPKKSFIFVTAVSDLQQMEQGKIEELASQIKEKVSLITK